MSENGNLPGDICGALVGSSSMYFIRYGIELFGMGEEMFGDLKVLEDLFIGLANMDPVVTVDSGIMWLFLKDPVPEDHHSVRGGYVAFRKLKDVIGKALAELLSSLDF